MGDTTATEQKTLEEMVKKEELTNCASKIKKNQRYTSSFFVNTTDANRELSVEKEFHDVVGNNSKVKKSSSVHDGEDITLCWIETTTIKEDKSLRPPKRLVIREYTISFENSATIPERYLECKRFEGELTTNDPDVGKTVLFEVIDEDTMVSRIVNFTSVKHVGNIVIWQHKKVKCGVGPVVSKNIIELTDDSKNPKKRVEIKVSPKINQLTAMTTEEEPCTESTTEHTTGLSCENGACKVTTTSPSISIKSDEIISKQQSTTVSESKEDHSLSLVTKSSNEEVSRRSTTSPKITTMIEESHEKVDCEENSSDPVCLTQIHGTVSSEEIFSGSIVTEASTKTTASAEISLISDTEVTSKEEISYSSIKKSLEEITQIDQEKGKVTSDLETKETTPLVTAISVTDSSEDIESSEEYVFQSTDETSVKGSNTTPLETKITSHAPRDVQYSKSEEGSSEYNSIELTSKELGEVVSSSSTFIETSEEVDTESGVTTAISPIEFIETKEPDKLDQILNKLTEPSVSTESVIKTEESSLTSKEVSSMESEESVTKTVIKESSSTLGEVSSTESEESATETVIEESLSMSEEVSSMKSKESATEIGIEESSLMSEKVSFTKSEESLTPAIKKTTIVRQKPSGEEEFISTIRTTSPTVIKTTTSSPVTSSEIETSCENSVECISFENCDESGSCGETTAKCDSEICSEEEVTESQSKFDNISSPKSTKIPLSATDLQSLEESTMIKNQYTTIATNILTSEESENWTIVNVPNTTDTQRSTTPPHKLTLRVKVFLEHINENNEKRNLVEVEKNLSLEENPIHHDNPDLLEQLKSLNKSVNMETINALLNCTSLGNLTRDSKLISKKADDTVEDSDAELEFKNSELEDSMSEKFISGLSEYQDHLEYQDESSRRRRRRSLNDEIKVLNRLKRSPYESTDSTVDSVNITQSLHTESTTDNSFSTTANYSEKETTYVENEQNVTKAERNESTTPTTLMNTIDNIDLSNASESHDANLTTENVQLIIATTNEPEEVTNHTVLLNDVTEKEYIEENVTNDRIESTASSINKTLSNETKMDALLETLPGIQEDVIAGLHHMITQLKSNLTAIHTNIKEAMKTNLLSILANPKDKRINLRRRRAATEEVGYWSNERIKESPMGGNVRSVTEFTLYKVLR
ncbi:mucin-4 [Solenopsis invicta]|uniref:mucin-4 n=1 Tax=Solenopsis invicta TaxID=13686 RepID=UPI00193DE4B1|nr:mucin-4 [Solenopsis invicta]